MVGITQPRRVAAVAMAQRVAHELGDELGGRVAYQVDALSLTRPQTRAQTQSLTLTLPLPLTPHPSPQRRWRGSATIPS